ILVPDGGYWSLSLCATVERSEGVGLTPKTLLGVGSFIWKRGDLLGLDHDSIWFSVL
ncbi:hypothetical protein Dimus_005404, partial [Dionaea muscipula]